MVAGLAERLGIGLTPKRILFENGAFADVDGVAQDESIFVEAYARCGPLRASGHRHKVATDVLKLGSLALSRDATFILAFCDAQAAGSVKGKSWLAQAIKLHGIRVEVVEIDPDVKARILAAQNEQAGGQARTPTLE